ncbi:hypothetical protein FRC07_012907, partial [Ceratobasidium sp. 392]
MPSSSSSEASEDTPETSGSSERPLLDTIELDDHSWLEPTPIPLVDDDDLHSRCLEVLEHMEQLDLSLGQLVWAINYGNKVSRACTKSKSARYNFMHGQYLVPTLLNIREPPRTKSKAKRADGARRKLDIFALSTVIKTFRDEVRSYSKLPGVNIRDFAHTDRLRAMTYERMELDIKRTCPILFRALHTLSTSVRRRSQWVVAQKDSAFFVAMQIAGISYETSQRNNNFQKLVSVYFHAEHVPKAVVEFLHRCNISMCYNWALENTRKLAIEVRKEIVEVTSAMPIMLCHDNIRIKFPVRSQRGDNQTATDNGTAMTMFVLPESARAAFEDPETIRVLRTRLENAHALGTSTSLSWTDLSDPQRRSRVFSHRLYHLFNILRSIPGVSQTGVLADKLLHRPASWHTLPHGPEHRTKMYMLATKPIDQSTYTRNVQVIDDVLRQMGLDRGKRLVRLTLLRILLWIGDEMT